MRAEPSTYLNDTSTFTKLIFSKQEESQNNYFTGTNLTKKVKIF